MKKRILVAPLDWGLGHATRCIPIIQQLLERDYEPVIASDGQSLQLLQQEFPKLDSIELPSYNIRYTQKEFWLKLTLLSQSFTILKTVRKEQKLLKKLIEQENLSGIISDNRLGLFSNEIPCVYLTHQVQVLSGITTFLSSKLHQHFLQKYTECWVPDYKEGETLSGKMGHPQKMNTFNLKYIGPLSRFHQNNSEEIYKILVVLSGPEPQRALLEERLLHAFQNYDQGKVVFVRGKIAKNIKKTLRGKLIIYNYLNSQALEKMMNQSELIIARSGYTTVMDVAKLQKKVFFIPTPGQTEQVYLAKRFHKMGLAPYCLQHQFSLKQLEKIDDYCGLIFHDFNRFSRFFSLFERK